MSLIAFDTHAFIKRLTAAGMPEPQAEIIADQQTRLIDEKLATKADLARTQDVLTADIADAARVMKSDLREVELRLEAKIETAKAEMIKWVFGAIGFQTIVMVDAVVAVARLGHS
jgi:hypothetical protein